MNFNKFWFPWKPKFIKIHEIPLFILLYQQLNTFISVVPNCEQVRQSLINWLMWRGYFGSSGRALVAVAVAERWLLYSD